MDIVGNSKFTPLESLDNSERSHPTTYIKFRSFRVKSLVVNIRDLH